MLRISDWGITDKGYFSYKNGETITVSKREQKAKFRLESALAKLETVKAGGAWLLHPQTCQADFCSLLCGSEPKPTSGLRAQLQNA